MWSAGKHCLHGQANTVQQSKPPPINLPAFSAKQGTTLQLPDHKPTHPATTLPGHRLHLLDCRLLITQLSQHQSCI